MVKEKKKHDKDDVAKQQEKICHEHFWQVWIRKHINPHSLKQLLTIITHKCILQQQLSTHHPSTEFLAYMNQHTTSRSS